VSNDSVDPVSDDEEKARIDVRSRLTGVLSDERRRAPP
jgi:hypothetical protein